ncbi:hypothetical protein BA895_12145 [Humibacillus sp. DSM 29435]|uniref:TniQ family protein n=1 Tax=Humibacillus sp. DSM 29435 TaxID=1869167 RepID=UPI0008725697|nr:TniQ family protein [Humibacillus sp. DSM 29435]OFE18376.1 hypothetical protein BA895_12145 [Humibacillus sp. DSM 29435]
MWADIANSPCLPTTIDLRPGEALDGYLERVADVNYLTTAHLLTQVRARADTTRFLMLAPSPATLRTLAAITGETVEHLQEATLARYDGNALDLTGLDPQRQSSFRTVAARGWLPGHGTQICPACLAETGTWAIAWRLPTSTVCDRHGTYLLAACPGCHRPFRDQRHSHLRAVGATTRCGNPLGEGPRAQCQLALTTLKAPPADPECLARHQRQVLAGSGLPVTVFGEPARPLEYAATLQALTVLLLHVASATTTPHDLPAWTAHLAADGDTRPHRWALHPPADPAVRSRALTTADTLLSTPDIDTAAAVFTTWCEKVPVTPDGRLGWLADHTRMTPTLTRLVMATHAPAAAPPGSWRIIRR